jgi:hypothetical protein
MNGSGLVCFERHPLGYLATSQKYCNLTRHGVTFWRTFISPSLVGPEMKHSEGNLEKKENWAVRASSKGTSFGAPCGATEQDPVEQRAGGTPLIGEERPPVAERTSENLEGLTEKLGTLGLQITRRIAAVLLGSGRGGPGSRRLSVVNPSPLQRIDRRLSRSPAHLGHRIVKDGLRLSQHLRRMAGPHKAQTNDSGRPVVLRRAGVLRGPNRLGNLVTLESPGRAIGWPLLVRNIQGFLS